MDKIIGFASGIAAGDVGCQDGASFLLNKYFSSAEILYPIDNVDKYHVTHEICQRLASKTFQYCNQNIFFTVVGGDHSSAIGTWSGLVKALAFKGDLGLIWIDAHLDSHSPATTISGNIHGMPVATLLGRGHPDLIHILSKAPIIKPQNLCLIGVRSYEPAELALMRELNIKVFFMQDILEQGLEKIFEEARSWVMKNTAAYGISIDLDAIDPLEAPGVGSPEQNGIHAEDLLNILKKYTPQDKADKKLLGFEIAEFNPHRDRDQLTEKLIIKLLQAVGNY